MTNESFSEDLSIAPVKECSVEQPETPVELATSETSLSPSLEANPVLEQVLPQTPISPDHPYQGLPLVAPSIVDPEPARLANSSAQVRNTSNAPNANVIQYFWLLVVGAAILALFAVSDFQARHNSPIPHVPPSRIPRTGAW